MVEGAAASYRVALQGPEPWGGLPSVDDAELRAGGDRVDIALRHGGDATQPLREVQRDALAGQEAPGSSCDVRAVRLSLQGLTVAGAVVDLHVGVHLPVHLPNHVDATQDQRFPGADAGFTPNTRGHAGLGRHVASPEVLLKGDRHDALDDGAGRWLLAGGHGRMLPRSSPQGKALTSSARPATPAVRLSP